MKTTRILITFLSTSNVYKIIRLLFAVVMQCQLDRRDLTPFRSLRCIMQIPHCAFQYMRL